MRILTLHPGPHFSVADVFNGWTKGLRAAGAQVVGFPYQSRLEFYHHALVPDGDGNVIEALTAEEAQHLAGKAVQAACYEFLPDVLVVVSGMFVPLGLLDLVRARGTTVVGLLTEQPYETARELNLAKHCDLVVLNDPANLAAFEQVTAAYYQPHSYDPDLHHPGPGRPEWACDIGWVGTAFESRIRFLDKVDWPTDSVRFGGLWQRLPEDHRFNRWLIASRDECVDNDETVELYRVAKMSFNLYRSMTEDGGHGDPNSAEPWAMGPREVELAATGCFFLRQPRPEGDELLPMLPRFDDPAEFSALAKWWLANDGRRDLAATAARACVADRTFTNAARRLLTRLERVLVAA